MEQALSQRLKELMEQKGWSISRLASESKLEESAIQAILEDGSYRASMKEVVALTKALDVSLNEFSEKLNLDD